MGMRLINSATQTNWLTIKTSGGQFMTKNHIKTHQNSKVRKKGKTVADNAPQASQVPQLLSFGEIKKSNGTNSTNNQISKNIDIKKLKLFIDKAFDNYKDNPKALGFWYDSLLTKFTRSLMKQGKLPDDFTMITLCRSCGYVYVPPELINNGFGCPWCWNRVKGLPIPRPTAGSRQIRGANE